RNVFDCGNFIFAKVRRPHAPFLHRKVLDQTITDTLNDTAIDLPLMADWVHNGSRIVGCSETTELPFARLRVYENLGYLSRKRGYRRLVVVSIDRLSDDGAANAREEFAPRVVFSSFLIEELSSHKGRLALWPSKQFFGETQ